MKGFGRLFEESRRFYLCVLAMVALFVFADCTWICNDNNISLTKSGIEQMVQISLEQDNGVSLENHYMSLYDVVISKGTEFGLFLTMLGVIGLLFAREMAFTDVRTLEFRCTWPMKNWVRELYDYVAMLVVILFGIILQTVILLLVQIRYNGLLVKVLAEQGITSKATEVMSASNQYLLISMACYLMAIVVTYTWITLGMSLAKNPIAGIIISVVVKLLLQILWACLGWSIVVALTSDVASAQSIYYYNDLADYVESIGNYLLMHMEFFYGVDVPSGTIGGYGDAFTVTHWAVLQGVFCVLLIVGIVISAKKKDLAKGKVLYFPVLAYPLGILVGFGVFVICMEWFWWDALEIGIILSIVLSTASAIGTCLLCHPFSKSKSVRLEVK